MEFKTDLCPKGDEVTVSEVSINYTQGSELHSDDYNNLKLSILDQGAGFYFVMETERWAFDNIDQLIKVLNDFKNKAGV